MRYGIGLASGQLPSEPENPDASAGTSATLLDVTGAWDAAEARRTAATRSLPLEMKRAAVAGLGISALVFAFVVASYVVLLGVMAQGDRTAIPALSGYLHKLLPLLLLNLALFGVSRVRSADPDMVVRLGLVHFALVAFLLGLFRHSHPWPAGEAVRQWSPVAMWILLFGALVPIRPGAVLGWSLFAALLDPFALLTTKGRMSPPSPAEGILLIVSPFLAALLAYVTSSVIYRLNERIATAREFGSYKLVEKLGQGGMAEVWRANHHMLARPAAIKLIRKGVLELYGDKESARLVRLFEKEVQATAALRSPHTIQVYDFGIARDGTFYYVMELLDGFDMQTLVERFGRQPPDRVVHLLTQVCHSLHEAHREHLVHRDLKPGNIYVCRYGADLDFAKVLDFGLVLDRRPTVEEIDHHSGRIGTPSIMAPEQIRFGAPVDERTDIYALGCVAYWLLTGLRVFEAETRNDMLVMHAHQRPVPPSRRARIDIPQRLEDLVMKCLDKNPNHRPASARELSRLLGELELSPAWTRESMESWWNRGSALISR